jgi:hypothetical protein
MRSLMILATTFTMAGCALFGAKDADSPADVDEQVTAPLQSGSAVCISELVGVRYPIEDELEKQALAVEGSCMVADVQLQEQGEPSAWVMRYQRIGDADWKECKSNHAERGVFAAKCIGQMINDLGES